MFGVLFQAIKWDLSPVTSSSWLNIYLQVANAENIRGGEHGFVFPQYSSHAFVQIARVRSLVPLTRTCVLVFQQSYKNCGCIILALKLFEDQTFLSVWFIGVLFTSWLKKDSKHLIKFLNTNDDQSEFSLQIRLSKGLLRSKTYNIQLTVCCLHVSVVGPVYVGHRKSTVPVQCVGSGSSLPQLY